MCVVAHPATPGLGKSRTGGLYTSCPRAKSAGQGERGEYGFKPPALCPQPICSRDRSLLRVENAQTTGIEWIPRRIEGLASGARNRYLGAVSRIPEIVACSKNRYWGAQYRNSPGAPWEIYESDVLISPGDLLLSPLTLFLRLNRCAAFALRGAADARQPCGAARRLRLLCDRRPRFLSSDRQDFSGISRGD